MIPPSNENSTASVATPETILTVQEVLTDLMINPRPELPVFSVSTDITTPKYVPCRATILILVIIVLVFISVMLMIYFHNGMEQKGYCVSDSGIDVNHSYRTHAEKDITKEECLSWCLEMNQGTACEYIWNRFNAGCYLFLTTDVKKGNGVDNHFCWIFDLSLAPVISPIQSFTPSSSP